MKANRDKLAKVPLCYKKACLYATSSRRPQEYCAIPRRDVYTLINKTVDAAELTICTYVHTHVANGEVWEILVHV